MKVVIMMSKAVEYRLIALTMHVDWSILHNCVPDWLQVNDARSDLHQLGCLRTQTACLLCGELAMHDVTSASGKIAMHWMWPPLPARSRMQPATSDGYVSSSTESAASAKPYDHSSIAGSRYWKWADVSSSHLLNSISWNPLRGPSPPKNPTMCWMTTNLILTPINAYSK